MNTNTKPKGKWNYENKWRELEYDTIQLLNGAVFFLESILSNVSKYKKYELESDVFEEDKPTSFCILDEVKNETWKCSFSYWTSDGCTVYMQNITTNKNCVFKFPYKKLKGRYWREKVSTWIVEETFKKTMDIEEEVLKSFMSYKCIFKNSYNFIVYE